MSSRTYYDILGVSRDATLEEITSAKNALAKVYHPDANMVFMMLFLNMRSHQTV